MNTFRVILGAITYLSLLVFIAMAYAGLVGLGVWFLVTGCIETGTLLPLFNLFWMVPVAVGLFIGGAFGVYGSFLLAVRIGWSG